MRALLWRELGSGFELGYRLRFSLFLASGARILHPEVTDPVHPSPFAFPRSMRLPRRVGDAAELRKVGAGDRNSWQVGWAMASFLTVLSAPSRPPAEPEATAGEAPTRADQPEPEPAEGSSIAAAGRGGESLGAQRTEMESLGAPSEAGGPAWSQGSVGVQRPACDLRDGVVGTTA